MPNVTGAGGAIRVSRRTPMVTQPFSLEPVVELLGGRARKANGHRVDGSISTVSRRLGMNRRRVYRLLRSGLDAYQADAVATGLGVHPSRIWSDWFDYVTRDRLVREPQKRSAGEALLVDLVRPWREQGLGWETIVGRVRDAGMMDPPPCAKRIQRLCALTLTTELGPPPPFAVRWR